jgi:hypothetical protein
MSVPDRRVSETASISDTLRCADNYPTMLARQALGAEGLALWPMT